MDNNRNQSPMEELAVTAACLNVRELPDKESTVLFQVTEGTRLYKLSEAGDFYKVRTQTGQVRAGFVMRKYVKRI